MIVPKKNMNYPTLECISAYSERKCPKPCFVPPAPSIDFFPWSSIVSMSSWTVQTTINPEHPSAPQPDPVHACLDSDSLQPFSLIIVHMMRSAFQFLAHIDLLCMSLLQSNVCFFSSIVFSPVVTQPCSTNADD